MSALPTQFPVSLRSWPSNEADPNKALPFLIQRINSERGGFLNLDEDELREQIAKEEAGGETADDSAASPEDGEEKPDRMKELMAAREEMLAQIEQAHQQAMFALDFVSLLISKDQPNQASLSISPFLRENVGMGTLGADKIQVSKVTEAQKEDNKNIAKGWKVQNLNKTADSILASATRLEKEIELETTYWKQVLAISENGWAICRLPNEKHTLGVRFGFSEAGPTFKNRSLAALRREPDGSISLDHGIATSEPQYVRVRVYSNGKQTGCSTIPSDFNEDAPIEERIQQARNVVFESELWHELNRESRTLQALGVRGKNDTILYPLSPTKTVVLDQIYLGKYSPEPSGDDDTLAEGISLSLHLLQSYAHRRNFFRRTDSTGPLTSFKRVNTPYALLRSLITRANHQSTLSRIHALFGTICSILTAMSYSPHPNYAVTEPPLDLRPNLAPTEATVVTLFEHLNAQVTLNLTESCTLNMKIRTSLYPLTTTNFNLTLEPPDCLLQETCRAPGIVDQWHKSYDYILFVTSCALASSLVSSSPRTNDRDGTIGGQQNSQSPQWTSTTRPHVIRLVPGCQESRPHVKSKQASFSLSPVSSPGATNEQSSLKLRISWECISDSAERLSAEGRIPEYKDTQEWKPANGEGFYEWIISEGESKVVGRGASSGENSWSPGSSVKSLQEVMQLAAEP